MCFNQNGAITLLNEQSLKLIDQFLYLGSNISSTKSNVSIHIGKTLTAIHKLSTIYKSDLSGKIKWKSLQAVAGSILWLHYLDYNVWKS